MQVNSRRHAPQADRPASELACPCCQGLLVRERRRIVDRLRSLIRPVKRYRCENFACQWSGNMANTDAGSADSGMTAGVKGEGDNDSRSSGVPSSFVVHMILVAVGVVFVIVYSTMEPAVSYVASDSIFGTIVLK